jgi:hypothetical protein
MNCEVVQRQLLSGESPDSPTAAASAHLADCAACREWLMRLVQVERALPFLPVPPAEAARSALMRRILSQKEGNAPEVKNRRRPSVAMVLGSWIMDRHSSPRRRVAAGLVAGVAAALLLFIVSWIVWYGGTARDTVAYDTPRVPSDQLLADLGRAGIHTADGKVGGERIQAMATVAGQLHDKCPGLAKSGDFTELIEKAQLYVRVVDDGIVKTAEGMTSEDRRAIFNSIASIAKDLGNAESQWKSLAASADLTNGARLALTGAAEAAIRARDRLNELTA